MAVPTAANRYWVDWFWCTQFIVVYKKLYARILSYNFKDTDTADGVLSGLARFKMVIYPFVSRQKAFGYSDITEGNMKHPDLIVRHFERADVRLKQVHAVSHIFIIIRGIMIKWALPRLTINKEWLRHHWGQRR